MKPLHLKKEQFCLKHHFIIFENNAFAEGVFKMFKKRTYFIILILLFFFQQNGQCLSLLIKPIQQILNALLNSGDFIHTKCVLNILKVSHKEI